MSGVKGRSGRKPLVNERTMEELLQCSAEHLQRIMTNPEVTNEDKSKIALALVHKYTPSSQTIDHEGLEIKSREIIVIHNYDSRQNHDIPVQQAESRLADVTEA